MRIAITGATGFVGARLAERIVLDGQHDAVALIRRFSGPGLARLARLPVRLATADLSDETALRSALADCDAVVHCAYGTSGTPEERFRTTVEGTGTLLRAAAAAGARKLVHLSSTAVHGIPADGTIDETTPFAEPRTNYDRMKQAAEGVVAEWHRTTGFPVVVIRPPLIYGPFGRRWTVRILEEIREGATLVEAGVGAANLVYVDNLVDLILAAVESDRGDGGTFVTVDPEPATWAQVYEGYRSLLPGAPPLATITRDEALRALKRANPGVGYRSLVLPWRLAPGLAAAALSSREMRKKVRQVPWVDAAGRHLPDRLKARLGGPAVGGREARAPGGLPAGLDRDVLDLLCSRARCDGSLAARTYGHRPRVAFAEALERIGAWARYQGLARDSRG